MTPATICVDEYPQLRAVAWHVAPRTHLSQAQALSIYERYWELVDVKALSVDEKQLITDLTTNVGGGFFCASC